MKPKEIRELSTEEIEQRLRDDDSAMHQLQFQHAIADLEDPMIIRRKRREVARFRTILRERAADSAEMAEPLVNEEA